MISAVAIADSISNEGNRLLSIQSNFHRYVLAEINTHRVFSRNYRSSRAVPVKKLIEEVRKNPAMPVFWGLNQPGMGTDKELEGVGLNNAQDGWRKAAQKAADSAEYLMALGLAKEVANRVLEPYLYVPGLISSTTWMNFFGLRLDKAAQPEARAFAEAVWRVWNDSKPKLLQPGEWHLPYIDESDWEEADKKAGYFAQPIDWLKKISAARCARASYKVFDADRKPTLEEDIALFNKLAGKQPIHASPLEHVATPDNFEKPSPETAYFGWRHQTEWGNFYGWRQFRKQIEGEEMAPLPEGYNVQ